MTCHLQIHNIKTHSPLEQKSIKFFCDFPYPHPFTKIGHSGELLASAIFVFKKLRVMSIYAMQSVRELSYKKGTELAKNIWTGGSQKNVLKFHFHFSLLKDKKKNLRNYTLCPTCGVTVFLLLPSI